MTLTVSLPPPLFIPDALAHISDSVKKHTSLLSVAKIYRLCHIHVVIHGHGQLSGLSPLFLTGADTDNDPLDLSEIDFEDNIVQKT